MDVLFGVWMTTHNFKEFKLPKTPKGAFLGIFQPNWQNYKTQYLRRRRGGQRQIVTG